MPDVSFTVDAKLAPATRKFIKLAAQLSNVEKGADKVTKGLGRTSRAANKAGTSLANAGEKGSGKFAKGLGTLASKLGPLVGGGGLLTAFAGAVSGITSESDKAAASLLAVEASMRRLIQLSLDQPEKFPLLKAQAKELAVTAGIPFQKALDLTFLAGSADLIGPGKGITAAAVEVGEEPVKVFEALVTLLRNFPAEELETLFNQTLAAAIKTKKSFVATAEAAARSAPAAKVVGAGITETLALSAALIDIEVGVERAATRFQQLAAGAQEGGFREFGVVEGLRRFQEETPKAFEKYDDSNKEFARAVASLPAALERLPDIQAAIEKSTVGETLLQRAGRVAAADPLLVKAERTRQQRAGVEIERLERGAGRALDLGAERTEFKRLRRIGTERFRERDLPGSAFLNELQLLLELAASKLLSTIDEEFEARNLRETNLRIRQNLGVLPVAEQILKESLEEQRRLNALIEKSTGEQTATLKEISANTGIGRTENDVATVGLHTEEYRQAQPSEGEVE